MEFKKSDLKRYGVLFFGLIMAAGFTFGGMASMSSMIQSPSADSGQSSTQDAELPSEQYSSEQFNLTDDQRLYLAASESVVFVTGYYSSEEDKEMLSELEQLTEIFGDAVYVDLSDEDSGRILDEAGVSDYPAIVVNGGVTQEREMRLQSEQNVSEVDIDEVTQMVCTAFSSYPNDAAKTTCV